MKAFYYKLSGYVLAVCLITIIGCSSLSEKSDDELLSNMSFHILKNDNMQIPTKGTYDFDIKYFKVKYTESVDLAAIDKRVISSIEKTLKNKGFRLNTKDPDILISYAVAIDSPISSKEFNGAYAKEFPLSFPELEAGKDLNYHKGALIVDFVDVKSRKLLWRGAIMADIRMDVSDRKKDRRVKYGVGILLHHFPRPIVK
ncbi:DUF4136 domain-containing protein [bacterium AH-315-E10]|nr:DUF4136 domain-containing protein [bacterium AH-315-E10]